MDYFEEQLAETARCTRDGNDKSSSFSGGQIALVTSDTIEDTVAVPILQFAACELPEAKTQSVTTSLSRTKIGMLRAEWNHQSGGQMDIRKMKGL